jgi:hypothetical protein
MAKYLSTQQAADKIGISKRQLLRWLYAGRIPEVRREQVGGVEARVWTRSDVRRAAIKASKFRNAPAKSGDQDVLGRRRVIAQP